MQKIILLILGLAMGANAICPGADSACSGHGSCQPNDKCLCYRNWQGIDCSQRKCPQVTAWADVIETGNAGETRDAHYYAECAGKGVCDRNTGQCECFPGFEGKGCTRMSCPNNCNGHGTCEYLDEINTSYTGWDAHKIQICRCDPGFDGYDCSRKLCRTGDDPMTAGSAPETQRIDISAASTGDFALKFTDWRGETWTTWVFDYSTVTALAIKEALEAIPNQAVPSVTVTESSSKVFDVTFDLVHNTGNQNLLMVLSTQCNTDGCQPFLTNGLDASGTITQQTASDMEAAVCSNRGTCNFNTGICECESGYYGESCSDQTIIM